MEIIFYISGMTVRHGKTLNEFNKIILSSLFFSVIISVFGVLIIAYYYLPIKIMHKARRLAAGEFDQMLEVKSDDEMVS